MHIKASPTAEEKKNQPERLRNFKHVLKDLYPLTQTHTHTVEEAGGKRLEGDCMAAGLNPCLSRKTCGRGITISNL